MVHSAFGQRSLLHLPLQFGFKEGFSSDLCTGLLKNIVARYAYSESTVFGCFINASKAFDRVNHAVRFQKLLKKNLSRVILRTLLYWYSEQKVYMRTLESFPL